MDAAAVNIAATITREGDQGDLGIVVSIGGVEVHVGMRDDGRLRVWLELDDEEAPLLHSETGLLPVVLGIAESVALETDERGLHATSAVFERQ